MNKPLDAYRAKRDFSKTPEPAGKQRRTKAGNAYVIQKHAAWCPRRYIYSGPG